MKYYICIDKNNYIWGIGNSKTKALTDAKQAAKWCNLDWRRLQLKSHEGSKALYCQVKESGERQDWRFEHGIARLESELRKEAVERLRDKHASDITAEDIDNELLSHSDKLFLLARMFEYDRTETERINSEIKSLGERLDDLVYTNDLSHGDF